MQFRSIIGIIALTLIPLGAQTKTPKAEMVQEPLYSYKSSNFSLNFLAAILTDYTFFKQDTSSLLQVGPQEDQFDLRAFRTGIAGKFNLFDEQFGYIFICESGAYIENKNKVNNLCSIMNMALIYNLPDDHGWLTVGKMKEPWSYEMVGDSVNLPHHERFLSPMFQSRNVGIRYNNTYAKQRGTFAIGFYNDWLESSDSFEENGYQVSARITGLSYISDDNMNYLHFGGSLRYNNGDKGTLQYQGKPESNVADWYVDTGILEADHALEFGLEALWSYNGFSLLGEYLQSNIISPSLGDPTLDGWYITGGWVLTGESRPYDRRVGYARRIIPQNDMGAVELIARYGNIDLDDKQVHGGRMSKWMLGTNWWIDRDWKASISYGTSTLDRFNIEGETDIMLFRLQWIR